MGGGVLFYMRGMYMRCMGWPIWLITELNWIIFFIIFLKASQIHGNNSVFFVSSLNVNMFFDFSGFPVNGDSNRFAVDGKRLYKCIAPHVRVNWFFLCHFKIHVRARWAEEPANFLAAPALALTPDFFSKRLRLLFFFQTAPAPAPRRQKHPAPSGFLFFLLKLYMFWFEVIDCIS